MKAAHWEWRAGLHAWKRCIPLLAYAAVLSYARYFLRDTSGVLAFLVAGALVLAGLLLVKEIATLLARGLGLMLRLRFLTNVALVAGSVMMTFVLIEAALQVSTWFRKPEDRTGLLAGLTMPAEWERRPAEVEGMSNVILEAMACGLPIVATDVPGNREVLGEEGLAGRVVPAGSPAPLAEAIETLVASAGLRRDLGGAARAEVEKRFDIRRVVGQYLSLYTALLS